MHFDLTEEQSLLRDSVTRLLKERYPFETRRKAAASADGWSREIWAAFAEQGLLGVGLGEDAGGYGGAVETMVVAEALGGALSAEPYLATVVMGAAALRLSGADGVSKTLSSIAAGEHLLAVAEGFSAKRAGENWSLHGKAASIPHADCAHQIIVIADDGALVACVDAGKLNRAGHRTFDGLRAAHLEAASIAVSPAEVLAHGAAGLDLAERVRQHGVAYIAAEAVGLMCMLLDVTVEHLKTRQQFGQPLSRFQALQHRAVDMLVALEQARSMAIYATAALDEPDALERRKAFAAIKAVVSNAARLVGQQAVQLLGGIGLTEEHRVGWGLRRLTMIDLAFGDADEQAARLAALGGLVAPA
jgi:alkylation response protein AidB-like acyl-CoA dehydrogenase